MTVHRAPQDRGWSRTLALGRATYTRQINSPETIHMEGVAGGRDAAKARTKEALGRPPALSGALICPALILTPCHSTLRGKFLYMKFILITLRRLNPVDARSRCCGVTGSNADPDTTAAHGPSRGSHTGSRYLKPHKRRDGALGGCVRDRRRRNGRARSRRARAGVAGCSRTAGAARGGPHGPGAPAHGGRRGCSPAMGHGAVAPRRARGPCAAGGRQGRRRWGLRREGGPAAVPRERRAAEGEPGARGSRCAPLPRRSFAERRRARVGTALSDHRQVLQQRVYAGAAASAACLLSPP
jgi:hypothetical protein